jgi:hypothetical protein
MDPGADVPKGQLSRGARETRKAPGLLQKATKETNKAGGAGPCHWMFFVPFVSFCEIHLIWCFGIFVRYLRQHFLWYPSDNRGRVNYGTNVSIIEKTPRNKTTSKMKGKAL